MKELNICLKNEKDALDMVTTLSTYPADIDLCRGSIVIDAKSILGVLGLGVRNITKLLIHMDEPDELVSKLKKYAC